MLATYRKSRMLILVLLVSLFSFSMIVGCGQNESTNAESETNSGSQEVAIKVGSETISMSEFNERVNSRFQQFKQNPRMKQQLQRLPEDKRQQQFQRLKDRLKRQLARQLETQLLLDYHVKQAGITVSDEQVQERIDQLKERSPQLKKRLKQQGQSLDSLKSRIREQMRLKKFVDQKAGEIEVSDQEARKYFEENKNEFSKPERVKARHILISDTSAKGKDKAESLKSQLDDGANFAELAKKQSDGPSSRRGGNLDYITRDEMVKPFSDAAFSLGVGEVSGPVKTRYGWHLIKVEDKKAASEANYEDVSDTIVQRVTERKKKQKFREILSKLRQETEVVNNVAPRSAGQPQGQGTPPPATP